MNEYNRFLLGHIKKNQVLDIGSIGHNFEERNRYDTWLFEFILKNAMTVIGIDYLESQVIKAQKAGYAILLADAQNFTLDKKFDVVHAGDIIEHLSNPGQFIECCYKHLKKGGKVIVATPNTYSFMQIFGMIKGWTNTPTTNPEHTCYFTPQTIDELFRRYNFSPIETFYVHSNLKRHSIQKIFQSINIMLCKLLGSKFKETFVKVYTKNT